MTVEQEPERWLTADEEPAVQLRPALRMAQADGPSAAEYERIWGALAGALPPASNGGNGAASESGGFEAGPDGSGGVSKSAAPAAARRPAVRTKSWGVVGTGIGAAALGFMAARWTAPSPVAPESQSNSAALSAPAAAATTRNAALPAAGPSAGGPSLEPRAPAGEPLAIVVPAPAQVRVVARPPATAERARTRSAPEPAGQEAASADGAFQRELELLARGRRIVASAPARALQLTAEHALRYRDGVLAQEREVLAIDALMRLGRRELARARARSFAARYPDSAYRVRLAAELTE